MSRKDRQKKQNKLEKRQALIAAARKSQAQAVARSAENEKQPELSETTRLANESGQSIVSVAEENVTAAHQPDVPQAAPAEKKAKRPDVSGTWQSAPETGEKTALTERTQRRRSPMAGRVIVVTSGKGGVGKTTTTANISMALAKLGKKVVVVDGDTGLRNLDIILGLENRIVYTLVDVVEGNCELKKALIRDKRVDGLYLLPTAQTRQKDCVSEEQMKNLSDELKKDFEFVLFDCPAGIESGFKNASAGASEALVVTTPDVAPVRDADRIIGMLEAQGKEQIHLIINRLVPKMMRKGDMLGVGDVLDILSVPLIGVVPEDDLVLRSSNNGEPLTLSPNSPAATAFTNIARRLLGEEVPFLDVESMDKGFLASLRHFFGRK